MLQTRLSLSVACLGMSYLIAVGGSGCGSSVALTSPTQPSSGRSSVCPERPITAVPGSNFTTPDATACSYIHESQSSQSRVDGQVVGENPGELFATRLEGVEVSICSGDLITCRRDFVTASAGSGPQKKGRAGRKEKRQAEKDSEHILAVGKTDTSGAFHLAADLSPDEYLLVVRDPDSRELMAMARLSVTQSGGQHDVKIVVPLDQRLREDSNPEPNPEQGTPPSPPPTATTPNETPPVAATPPSTSQGADQPPPKPTPAGALTLQPRGKDVSPPPE